MNKALQQLIKAGESSRVQFKERIFDKYDTACEIAAFCNSHGGTLIVGVKDKTGKLNALSYAEVQETTNLLSAIASENVVPSILIDIVTVSVNGGGLIVVTVKEGLNKPYHDNKGIVWVKNGADKRKVFDNAELAEMMTECGNFTPDEATVKGATVEDLDEDTLKEFFSNRFEKVLEQKGLLGAALKDTPINKICASIAKGHDCEKILRNLRFIRPDGSLTVAAMLLFGKYPQRWLPVMTAKCICFAGNDLGGKVFRDKVNDADMEGNLLHQYKTIMDFFTRNLRNIQVKPEFNSPGKLEIPYSSLVEFTVNSLVHRSLNIKAPVRIFIFDNRIEIHSPGALPNGLTIDDIKSGTSLPRNTFLFSNAIYLLPYTGVGSGITRALSEAANVTFTNNISAQEFVVTFKRDEVTDLDTDLGTKQSDLVTKHSYLDTDLDTDLVTQKEDLDTKRGDLVTDLVTKHGYLDTKETEVLSKQQKDLLNFCSVPRTSAEIMNRLGISNQTKNRERYITSLVKAGYLQMTNPENPKASNQKYQRTEKRWGGGAK